MPMPKWIEDTASLLEGALPSQSKEEEPTDAGLFDGLLNGAIEQIYLARETFCQDARHVLSTILLSYGAGGLVFFQFIDLPDDARAWKSIALAVLSVTAFLVPVAVRDILRWRLEAGYKLYCSAALHATVVAKAVGAPLTHSWMEYAMNCGTLKGRLVPWKHPNGNPSIFDDWDFDESKSEFPNLDTPGKIISIWMAQRPTQIGFYLKLIDKVMPAASWMLTLLVVLCLLMRLPVPECIGGSE